MRIIIATGGSGGHIYPALALADEIKKKIDSEILFIGSNNKMEQVEIPSHGYAFKGINVQGMNGGIKDKIIALYKLFKANKICNNIIEEFKPDIVIGFGNYISVSIVLAASRKHIPTMIHEQNSYAGKANKLLGSKVDAVVGCYEENLKEFKNKHIYILGNPRASQAKDTIKDRNILKTFSLDPNIKTVVCFMGSLGSESVNKVLEEAQKMFANKTYQVIIVTGKKHYDNFHKQESHNVKVVPYIDGLKVMAACDLCVIRAGATTASEVCVLGIPSIMIPSPYVPNNHQYYNAKALADKKASLLLEEKDLTADSLVSSIDLLINDDNKLNEMAENALKLGTPNASNDIIKLMKELVNQ